MKESIIQLVKESRSQADLMKKEAADLKETQKELRTQIKQMEEEGMEKLKREVAH
jgi:hypothetical protein